MSFRISHHCVTHNLHSPQLIPFVYAFRVIQQVQLFQSRIPEGEPVPWDEAYERLERIKREFGQIIGL